MLNNISLKKMCCKTICDHCEVKLNNILASKTYCETLYLSDTQGSYVLTVGCGSVACSPGTCQQTPDAFNANASVDGMSRRWWGAR